MKATFIKEIDNGKALQHIYKLDPPIKYTHWDEDEPERNRHYEYVVVSATYVPGSGPETYIFGSDEKGSVLNWTELDGSYRGGLSHAKAIENAGYKVTEGE